MHSFNDINKYLYKYTHAYVTNPLLIRDLTLNDDELNLLANIFLALPVIRTG